MPASLARASRQDLHDAGAQADQDPDLPGTVIGPVASKINAPPQAPDDDPTSSLFGLEHQASAKLTSYAALRPHSPRG